MTQAKKRRKLNRIQEKWLVDSVCRNISVSSPPYAVFPRSLLEAAVHKEIGLDSVAYYAYRKSLGVYLNKWAVSEMKDLGIPALAVERIRKELREKGFLTTLRLGTSTYTITNNSRLTKGGYKDFVFSNTSRGMRGRWGSLEHWKFEGFPRGAWRLSRVTTDSGSSQHFSEYRQPLMFALCQLLPEELGTNRMKAIGLWLILRNWKGPLHNWKSPTNISKSTGLGSHVTMRTLCRILQRLGLAFWKDNSFCVSAFPFERWTNLHPLTSNYFRDKWPWKQFGGSLPQTPLPQRELFKREYELVDWDNLPPVKPPLGYSRQTQRSTPKTKEIWDQILREEAELSARKRDGSPNISAIALENPLEENHNEQVAHYEIEKPPIPSEDEEHTLLTDSEREELQDWMTVMCEGDPMSDMEEFRLQQGYAERYPEDNPPLKS